MVVDNPFMIFKKIDMFSVVVCFCIRLKSDEWLQNDSAYSIGLRRVSSQSGTLCGIIFVLNFMVQGKVCTE